MNFRLPVSRPILFALVSCSLVGCADMRADTDSEVMNSMRFDTVACKDLIAQRDALVQTYGSPAGLAPGQQPGIRPTFKQQPMGIFSVPEYRGKKTIEKRRAYGEIQAMNRSIDRRECGKPQKKKSNSII